MNWSQDNENNKINKNKIRISWFVKIQGGKKPQAEEKNSLQSIIIIFTKSRSQYSQLKSKLSSSQDVIECNGNNTSHDLYI